MQRLDIIRRECNYRTFLEFMPMEDWNYVMNSEKCYFKF